MSAFSINTLTTAGINAIAKLVAGSTMEFTKIQVGDGTISGNPMTMTQLSHVVADVPITSARMTGQGTATITGTFSNADLQLGFFYRELGLFCKDPETKEEILFAYGNAQNDAEWIPPSGESTIIEKIINISTLIGNAEKVTAQVLSGVYVTKQELDELDKRKYDKTGGEIEGDVQVGGALTVSGQITANGGIIIKDGLTVRGGITTNNFKGTGNAEFDGPVNMAGTATIEKYLYLKNSLITKGQAPTEKRWSIIGIYDKNGGGDAAANRLAQMTYSLDNLHRAALNMYVANPANTASEENAGIIATWKDGVPRIYLTHQPPENSNDYDIASTMWAKTQITKAIDAAKEEIGGDISKITVNGHALDSNGNVDVFLARSDTGELATFYVQFVDGQARLSVSHHPSPDSNDKSIATTNWVKGLRATEAQYGLVRVANQEDVLKDDCEDAAIVPAVYHDVSDFRHKSTAYQVGDIVRCMYNSELFLECTQTGTTSADPLDTRAVSHGQVLTDGNLQWTVRTYIKSINGQVPDEHGNVDVNSGLSETDVENIVNGLIGNFNITDAKYSGFMGYIIFSNGLKFIWGRNEKSQSGETSVNMATTISQPKYAVTLVADSGDYPIRNCSAKVSDDGVRIRIFRETTSPDIVSYFVIGY